MLAAVAVDFSHRPNRCIPCYCPRCFHKRTDIIAVEHRSAMKLIRFFLCFIIQVISLNKMMVYAIPEDRLQLIDQPFTAPTVRPLMKIFLEERISEHDRSDADDSRSRIAHRSRPGTGYRLRPAEAHGVRWLCLCARILNVLPSSCTSGIEC